MTVEVIEVIRNAGTNGTTLVTFTRDGKTYKFHAGRHVGINRIKSLAQSLVLTAL